MSQKELTLGYSPFGTGTPDCFPFDAIFTYTKDCVSKGFDGIDAFVLWGGTDIHPSFYKQNPHRFNQAPLFPSERDKWEWKAMLHCKAKGIPIIGVCRGAQFLCAFAGGKLIQHCSHHNGSNHSVTDKFGNQYLVNSYHHQMMDITDIEADLIAWSSTNRSSVYYMETSDPPKHIKDQIFSGEWKEPEIVYFPTVRGLAIQGHPEWANQPELKEFKDQCNNLILDYLLTTQVWT